VTHQSPAASREDHEAMLMAGADVLAPSGHASTGFITESAVRWAASILLSRSFFLNLQDEVCISIVVLFTKCCILKHRMPGFHLLCCLIQERVVEFFFKS
jgi:hypothetical protein